MSGLCRRWKAQNKHPPLPSIRTQAWLARIHLSLSRDTQKEEQTLTVWKVLWFVLGSVLFHGYEIDMVRDSNNAMVLIFSFPRVHTKIFQTTPSHPSFLLPSHVLHMCITCSWHSLSTLSSWCCSLLFSDDGFSWVPSTCLGCFCKLSFFFCCPMLTRYRNDTLSVVNSNKEINDILSTRPVPAVIVCFFSPFFFF